MKRPNLARKPFLHTRPVWVVSGGIWALALALSASSLADFLSVRGQEKDAGKRLAALTRRASELSQQVSSLSRELSQVNWKKLKVEVDSVAQAASQRHLRWGQLLSDLEEVLPWDVRLESINPVVDKDGQVTVTLEGIATSREAWLRLLSRLMEDRRFANPIPRQEQAPGASNNVGYAFSLVVRYLPEVRS
ncbi:MAG: hypothetical protein ACP5NF_05465 [Thermoanaerobaculum sp.]